MAPRPTTKYFLRTPCPQSQSASSADLGILSSLLIPSNLFHTTSNHPPLLPLLVNMASRPTLTSPIICPGNWQTLSQPGRSNLYRIHVWPPRLDSLSSKLSFLLLPMIRLSMFWSCIGCYPNDYNLLYAHPVLSSSARFSPLFLIDYRSPSPSNLSDWGWPLHWRSQLGILYQLGTQIPSMLAAPSKRRHC